MGNGDSPTLNCDLPQQEQPPVPEQGSRAVAFTQYLPVLGVHDLFSKDSQGGKDSPRPFCTGSRAAGGGVQILRTHVVPTMAAEILQWGWETPLGPNRGPTSGITW